MLEVNGSDSLLNPITAVKCIIEAPGCHFAECRRTECRGALSNVNFSLTQKFLFSYLLPIELAWPIFEDLGLNCKTFYGRNSVRIVIS